MSSTSAPRLKQRTTGGLRAAAPVLVAASVAALTTFSSTSASAAPEEGQIRNADSTRAVAGGYIVVLKDARCSTRAR